MRRLRMIEIVKMYRFLFLLFNINPSPLPSQHDVGDDKFVFYDSFLMSSRPFQGLAFRSSAHSISAIDFYGKFIAPRAS